MRGVKRVVGGRNGLLREKPLGTRIEPLEGVESQKRTLEITK